VHRESHSFIVFRRGEVQTRRRHSVSGRAVGEAPRSAASHLRYYTPSRTTTLVERSEGPDAAGGDEPRSGSRKGCVYSSGMPARLTALHPFRDPDSRRLAVLFAIVYFAQGMWYLPNQTLTIVLKERGLSAGQVANFFTISTVPWLIKPLYGIVSDFFPLF